MQAAKFNREGLTAVKEGDPKAAAHLFSEGLQLEPDNIALLKNRAWAQAELGNYLAVVSDITAAWY